jgi:DinB family protein
MEQQFNIEIHYIFRMDLLREDLLNLLAGKGAHVEFDKALADFPVELRGKQVASAPHTAWQLLEHMRIAQWDILEFSRDQNHVSPEWPGGYWPIAPEPPDAKAWGASIAQFKEDLEAMRSLIRDPKSDLYSRIPHGEGQTLLREALVLADHNSYHLGQIVLLRKLLGSWPE